MTREWNGLVAVVVLLIGSLGLAVPAQADDVDSHTSRLDHLLQAARTWNRPGEKIWPPASMLKSGPRPRRTVSV